MRSRRTTRAQYSRDCEPVERSYILFEFSSKEQRKRTMASPYEPDHPVMCPYDNNHRIAQSRIQKHLVKCSRNFPPDYKISCPYNATHRLFERDLEKHVLQCADRRRLDGRSIYEMHSHHGSIKSPHEMENRSVIDCDESWDEESVANDTANGSICQIDVSMDRNIEPSPGCWLINRPINGFMAIRPPKGRAEALMMEESGDSAVEDMESVTSSACMGRGKPLVDRNLQLTKLGRGRGCIPPKN